MGISKSSLSRVKSNKRKPGNAFILGLIRAGMNPDDIFLIKKLPNGNKNFRPTLAVNKLNRNKQAGVNKDDDIRTTN